MKETSVLTATVLGALVGGVAGYLLFTERGKAIRRELEPALEDFVREVSGFRSSVQRIAGIATEGWNAFNSASGRMGEMRH